MSKKGAFFVYLFISVFFIASYSYVDAILTNSTDVTFLIQTSTRIIWGGGALTSLILGVIQLGRK